MGTLAYADSHPYWIPFWGQVRQPRADIGCAHQWKGLKIASMPVKGHSQALLAKKLATK
jgi:hypothetical protein